MEVVPRIHRIQMPFGDRFVCMFLLVGSDCALLIDSGTDEMPGKYLAPYLDQIGLSPEKIRYVISSHADFDHTAGNASVRDLCPGALLMCHTLDQHMVEDIECMIADRYSEYEADHDIGDGDEAKEFIRQSARQIPVDILLQGGETLRLGPDWCVDVLHTAGHTRGHLTVWDASSRTLIIADATLYNAVLRSDGKPAFPPTYRYVDTYVATMKTFMGMSFDTMLTSHYPVYKDAAIVEFLGESRAFVERLEQATLCALEGEDGPRTMRELIDILNPEMGEWPVSSSAYMCFPLLGHLERLVLHGRLVTGRRDGLMTFGPA